MLSIGPTSGFSAWCQPIRSTQLGMRWKRLVLRGIDRQHTRLAVVEQRPLAANKRSSGVVTAAASAPHVEWEEQGSRPPSPLPLDAQVRRSCMGCMLR